MGVLSFKLSPRRLIIYGVTLLFVFALVVGWMQSQSISGMRNIREWIHHNRAVQAALIQLRVSLLEAESSQRGYLLTGSDSFLNSYHDAKTEGLSQFGMLKALTSDNAWRQEDRLNEMEPLITDKFQFMDQTIALEKSGNHAAAEQLVKGGSGLQDMSSIRSILGEMQDIEGQVLLERQDAYQHYFRVNSLLSVVALSLCLGTTILILFIVRYLEQMQASVMRHALSEVFEYEKGQISVTEYMQRRIREMEANGISRDEARHLLGLGEVDLQALPVNARLQKER